MKVLLIKDVYKLGHAGEIKKVADGFGRNYLMPQGLAVLATPGALKQAERIKKEAAARRAVLNQEMSGLAELIEGVTLKFPARASETGKLYGSVTTQMIAEALNEEIGAEIDRRDIDSQPLRNLGEHKVPIRLTVDLVPEVNVIVYREGEAPPTPGEQVEGEGAPEAEVEAVETEGAENTDSQEFEDVEEIKAFEAEEAEDEVEEVEEPENVESEEVEEVAAEEAEDVEAEEEAEPEAG